MASVGAALAGLRLLLSVSTGARLARAASAALIAAIVLSMLTYYGLVAVGLTRWGRVISVDLIVAYAPQTSEFLRTLGYPPWLAAAAMTALAVMAWLAVYGFLHRYDWVSPLRRTVSRPLAAVLALGLLHQVTAQSGPGPGPTTC